MSTSSAPTPHPPITEEVPDSFLEEANQLLGHKINLRRPYRAVSGNGLWEAVRSVLLALGAKLPPGPSGAAKIEGEKAESTLRKHLHEAGLRQRNVQLRGDWFRRDQGHLLGFLEEGLLPVALICEGGKRYRLLDPRTGESKIVTPSVAATLSLTARMFYRPLPPGPVTAWGLLRHALYGQYGQLWIIAGVGLLAALLSLLVPLMTQIIVSDIIPGAERGQLLQITLALLLAAVVAALFRVTGAFALLRIEANGDHAAQTGVWDRLLRLPPSFFQQYTAGDLANRVDGINAIRHTLSSTVVNYLLGAIFALVNLLLIFYYNWKLALVAIVLTALAGCIDLLVAFVQLPYHRRSLNLGGRITGRLFQILSGVAKWKSAAAEGRALGRWSELFLAKKRADKISGYINAVAAAFKHGFPILTTLVNFGLFYFFLHAELTTGQFLGYNAAFTQLLGAVLAATSSTATLVNIIPIYERVRPILQSPMEQTQEGSDPGKIHGRIEVRNVGFKYPNDGPTVLRQVSFTLEPGEFVALVGPTGCGKSTLLRILLGFDRPQLGEVLYDGRDLRNLDVAAVRRQLGVVLQHDKILAGDIFHNIVGSHQRSLEDAWKAAERASLKEEIERLPMGMHTYISETGSTFSGGQLQRVIIARALVNEPTILFLDEATSALDNVSQATVSENIRSMKVTRLVIAQRLSTIRAADRILVLNEGVIAESGPYDELMENDGIFRKMAVRQLV